MSLRREKKKKPSVEEKKQSVTATYNEDAPLADVRQCIFRVTSGRHEKIGGFLRVNEGPYANVETFAGP